MTEEQFNSAYYMMHQMRQIKAYLDDPKEIRISGEGFHQLMSIGGVPDWLEDLVHTSEIDINLSVLIAAKNRLEFLKEQIEKI